MKISIIPQPLALKETQGQCPSPSSFELSPATRILFSPDAKAVGAALQAALPFETSAAESLADVAPNGSILLTTQGSDPALGAEGYTLTISPESILLRAPQPAGLFYGVQTLRQLLPLEKTNSVSIPCLEIRDQPRFAWRGVMLDVGRHIFPLDFIKRLLDVMALQKQNVLHWHLTDDQGWRIEIKKYAKLTEIGSQRAASPIPTARDTLDGQPYGGFYTQEEVKEVVAYAAERFITVVPEIEMPGHAVAALTSYPNLGCTGGPYQVRTFWGIADDVYCAGNEETYAFLQDVLSEVLALFPSQFIHIGGDECPKVRWEKCPKCQAAIQKNGLKDEHELQSYFVRRIEAYLNAQGRRLIGWDEILEGGLAPNASVMSWRGMEGGIQAAQEGHDVVMTPTSHCYLDYYQSEEREKEPPGIGGFLPLENSYSWLPVPPELSAAEAQHIVGVQANLWTEYIGEPDHASYMLFPRACALAELAWSAPETTAAAEAFNNFRARLAAFLPRLERMEMRYRNL